MPQQPRSIRHPEYRKAGPQKTTRDEAKKWAEEIGIFKNWSLKWESNSLLKWWNQQDTYHRGLFYLVAKDADSHHLTTYLVEAENGDEDSIDSLNRYCEGED